MSKKVIISIIAAGVFIVLLLFSSTLINAFLVPKQRQLSKIDLNTFIATATEQPLEYPIDVASVLDRLSSLDITGELGYVPKQVQAILCSEDRAYITAAAKIWAVDGKTYYRVVCSTPLLPNTEYKVILLITTQNNDVFIVRDNNIYAKNTVSWVKK